MALGQFIKSVAPALIGGAMGIGSHLLGRKERREQQQQQVEDQMMLNEQQKEHQLDIWNKTNYQAQADHMRKAGLNVGLMYGGQGQGGVTGSVGAGSASGGGHAPNPDLSMGLQLGLMDAQRKNIEADTKMKEAQAENTTADTKLKDYQAEFDDLRNEIQKESKWDQINAIKAEAEKLLGEANEAQVKGSIAERTQIEQGQKIINEAELSLLMLEATKEGTRLTREQADAIQQQIAQGWERLKVEREGQDVSRENMEKLAETMLWQAGIHATGNVINSIIDIRKMGWKRTPTNTPPALKDLTREQRQKLNLPSKKEYSEMSRQWNRR